MRVSIAVLVMAVLVSLPAFAESGHAADESDLPGHSSRAGHSSAAGAHHAQVKAGPVGLPAKPADATQIVKVTLTDAMKIQFDPELSSIKSGTVIQFVVTNTGKIPHEFSIGNQKDQQAHAAMMRKMPGMVHDDGTTLTVKPGMSDSLTWNFKGDDVVVFACNVPGHYEAGMFQKTALEP